MRNYWSDLTADELREHMQVSMAQLERACQIRSSCEAAYRDAKQELGRAEMDVKLFADRYDNQKEALEQLEGLDDLCEIDLARLLHPNFRKCETP